MGPPLFLSSFIYFFSTGYGRILPFESILIHTTLTSRFRHICCALQRSNSQSVDFIFFIILLISCLLFVYRLWHPFKFNSKAIHQLIVMGHIVFSSFFIIAIYGNQSHFYPRLMLLVYLLIWVNNSGAYFVGSLWGKTPLFPSISPNKSWEGFWGGQFFCLITGWAFYLLDSSFSHSPLLILCMSILIPSLATYGDLIQSQFKRIAGVKDSGRLFPGHGGFYDRMDSIIYAAPFIYLLIQITRYVS